MVVSRTGDLYVAYGTGKGTFGALHTVSPGWQKYNVLISAGDLNEDNHPDLLARDTAGVLWRYLGTGKGGFAARQRSVPVTRSTSTSPDPAMGWLCTERGCLPSLLRYEPVG